MRLVPMAMLQALTAWLFGQSQNYDRDQFRWRETYDDDCSSKSLDAPDEVSHGDALSSNIWLTQEKLNRKIVSEQVRPRLKSESLHFVPEP
jgi:hypothetical protein